MVVLLKPETESKLKELAATTGRQPDELVEDAMVGYLAELAEVRNAGQPLRRPQEWACCADRRAGSH